MARSPTRRVQRLVVEDVVDQAHGLVDADLRAVGGGDARRLLPAVLQRVEAEVREAGRLGMAEDPEQAALVAEMIVVDGDHAGHWLTSVANGILP